MAKYFDLKRRFIERPEYDSDELIHSAFSDKRLGWEKVLESRISIVVAPANYGKTTEMFERAALLRTNSHSAVFVALRKVSDRGSFEKALGQDDRKTYEEWKAAPVVPLTLFVDSLDEASASNRYGIENLLSEVAREVGWPSNLIRWVISTRPAVLSAAVLDTLTSLLVVPYVAPVKQKKLGSVAAAASTGTSGGAVRKVTVETDKIFLYSMAHLDEGQAKVYLMGKYGSLDAGDLLSLAGERGLSGFKNSPGGLDVLANMGLVASPPESLTDVYQRVVDVVQVLAPTEN